MGIQDLTLSLASSLVATSSKASSSGCLVLVADPWTSESDLGLEEELEKFSKVIMYGGLWLRIDYRYSG